MRWITLLCLVGFVSCSQPKPGTPPLPQPAKVPKRLVQTMTMAAATIPVPRQIFLNWSNTATWTVDRVDYSTDMTNWQTYCYVTNGYTNTVWLPLMPTNDFCAFKIYFVGFH